MKAKSIIALGLAAPVAGCTTTHMNGAYRPTATDVASKQEKRTFDEGSSWPMFWGLFNPGSFDVNEELTKQLRPDEELTSIEINDHISLGGFFLFICTGGIISHHTIELRGSTAITSRPPTGANVAPAPSKKTMRQGEGDNVSPAEPVRKDRSADYNEGFRDGVKDRGRVIVSGDGPVKPDRSSDYNEGYRDALQGR
jgi:hypothetical protein